MKDQECEVCHTKWSADDVLSCPTPEKHLSIEMKKFDKNLSGYNYKRKKDIKEFISEFFLPKSVLRKFIKEKEKGFVYEQATLPDGDARQVYYNQALSDLSNLLDQS